MHIPDEYLSNPVCMATATASTAALTWSILQLRAAQDRPRATVMAAAGCGVFSVHMLNFPIDHGTSGHLVGAAAASILLGPWAASLTMAVVLALECLLFGDGGLNALGANILNMAVLAPWGATAILAVRSRWRLIGALPAMVLAGFCSTILAAVGCACEISLSGTISLANVLPAMCQAHWLVGLAEGCFTAVLAVVICKRFDIANRPPIGGGVVRLSVALAFGLSVLLVPWASALPDGLAQVARALHLAEPQAAGPWTLAPEYILPGMEWPYMAMILPVVLGIAAVYLAAYGVGRLSTVRSRK